MKRSKVEQLEAVLANCSKSIVTEFLFARFNAREIHNMRENLWALLAYGRRAVVKLEANPFNAHRAEFIRIELRKMDKQCDELDEVWRGVGAALVGMAKEFDAATTFEQRCELLGVNVVDRAQLPADSGMVHIASAYGLEDSAAGRGLPHKSGPLCAAIQAHMHHVMFTTPEGREAMDKMWEKLTEPGGLFQGLPIYDEAGDGSMVRRPPKLALVATTPTIQPESQQ
ncbi:hypothetical protein ACQ4WP_03415 [Janthinobacterium sp. GB4P2]|uniref:hypothetical protein n=1 Tax=Janthinobacterium sp. GB4P2 TaxID=3424189 RepID=UPI003F2538AD